jgi:hypothetical protein
MDSILSACWNYAYSSVLLFVFGIHIYILHLFYHDEILRASSRGGAYTERAKVDCLFVCLFGVLFSFFYIREPDAGFFTAIFFPVVPMILYAGIKRMAGPNQFVMLA